MHNYNTVAMETMSCSYRHYSQPDAVLLVPPIMYSTSLRCW